MFTAKTNSDPNSLISSRSILIHGDNIFKSREMLGGVLDQLHSKQIVTTRLEAKELTLDQLENSLFSSSLFAQPEAVLIENLHSLPTSNRKKSLLAYCVDFLKKQIFESSSDQNPSELPLKQLIFWEKRLLTKTMLKPFVDANSHIFEFKISKLLFKWLESLSPEKQKKTTQLASFQQVLSQENEFVVFNMLVRQVRLLLELKTGGAPKVAPFLLPKLRRQANYFSLQKLLETHQNLVQIDKNIKTSNSNLSLTQQLDLLLLRL
jgi:DNA polymerase III delta subunit